MRLFLQEFYLFTTNLLNDFASASLHLRPHTEDRRHEYRERHLAWGKERSRSLDGVCRANAKPISNRWLQHLLARQIHTEVGETAFESYFKFSAVRNPWDKAISQYESLQLRPDLCTYIGLTNQTPFAGYLERIAHIEHVQWLPQLSFIQDSSGREIIDFVVRFETLEADMQKVFARIGINCSRLPLTNSSQRKPDYRSYYDSQTRAAVARMYAADIEHFKYRF